MKSLEHFTVIITGAGSGIGRQLAIQAAGQGASVIATDVNETGLAETEKLSVGNVTTAHLDVADSNAILAFADQIIPTLTQADGSAKPLILINNAGVALGSGRFQSPT